MNNPEIAIVVAMDEQRGIGKENRIPWRIPKDLTRLKDLTVGHATIIGRTSYESMAGYYLQSGRPTMSQRTHVVITRNEAFQMDPSHGFIVHSIDEAFERAQQLEKDKIFVIGGHQIYAQTLNRADKLYLTLVEGNFDCDTFFPDYSKFRNLTKNDPQEYNGLRYRFQELTQ